MRCEQLSALVAAQRCTPHVHHRYGGESDDEELSDEGDAEDGEASVGGDGASDGASDVSDDGEGLRHGIGAENRGAVARAGGAELGTGPAPVPVV